MSLATWTTEKVAAAKRVPFYVRGSWQIIRHAPIKVRIVMILFVLYLVSPLDIVPNFIPFLGILDDLVVATLAAVYIHRNLPELAEFLHLPKPTPGSLKAGIRRVFHLKPKD